MLMDARRRLAGIRHFVLAVAPDNEPSRRRASSASSGRAHMDEEDGLEHVFEQR